MVWHVLSQAQLVSPHRLGRGAALRQWGRKQGGREQRSGQGRSGRAGGVFSPLQEEYEECPDSYHHSQ